MTTLVDRILPPKPTDAEIAEGKPKRDAFREQVQTLQTQFDQSSQSLKDLHLTGGQVKQLESLLKKANAWLQANVEVTKRQVETEQVRFQEELQKLFLSIQTEVPLTLQNIPGEKQKTIASSITIPQIKASVQKAEKDIQNKATRAEEQAKLELQQRTLGQDISDASQSFAKYGGIVVMILLALRVGSFAANASLHEPVPIRILNFIFTALFFPIFIFYYGYFEIRHLLWPDETEALRVESMIPIYGYVETKNPISFADRLFGYPETESLLQEISKKKEIIEQRRLDVLKISKLVELTSLK